MCRTSLRRGAKPENLDRQTTLVIVKIAIVVEQHIRRISEASDRFACYQNRFDDPHRSAGATQAPLPGMERRLRMDVVEGGPGKT
jgi:hypothetical protein